MICPDPQNPGFSDVSYSAEGWAAGGTSQLELENAVLNCNSDILSLEDDNEKPLVTIYPNPSSDFATVDINPTEKSNVSIEVINSLGQIVFFVQNEMSSGNNKIEIPVEMMSSGVYHVSINIGDKIVTEKLHIVK